MAVNDFGPSGGTGAPRGGMIGRVQRILLQPKQEWPAIDAEPMTVKGIMMGWAVPLAAIGPVAQFIGGQVFGYGGFGFVFRPPLMFALIQAVVAYALSLLSVWVLSLIIDALAPTFNGAKNRVSAMKVAAFSMTASWLAGIFGIIPMLGFLALLGLYSFYLLYLGLPRLMRASEDKAVPYTIVTVVVGIVLAFVAVAITSAFTGMALRAATPGMTLGAAGGTVAVPGVGSVDLGKMNAAAAQMAAAGDQMAAASNKMAATGTTTAAATPPVAPAVLAAMLPTAIGGWSRTEIESAGGAAGGIGGSSASAHYTRGADTMTLEVADIGAMGALASLGSALNVQSDKQTATGYDRTSTVDGRMTSAKWDSAAREGEYSTVVANRFTVKAEGHAPDDATFKAAVASVDMNKLAALAAH